MKILLLTSSMSSGGAERVASTLANAWATRGDHVTLMPTFSGRGECFYELLPNIRLVYLADLISKPARWIEPMLRLRALRQFMATERPDVIVSFLSNVNVSAIVASFGLRIPIIVCERTDSFVTPMSFLLRLACRFTYPLSSALMVQTHAVGAKYETSKWFLKKVRVIPNPVSEQMSQIAYQASGKAMKRVISVGRLDLGKQLSLVIRIFSNLAKNNNDWTLRIVGEGPLRSVLQQQITDLALEGRVELLGRSTNIGREYFEADIFVLTSKYEGFPNALLEAMAVGLPCVTFDCPSGPREISMDGQVALLVPLNDEQAFEQAMGRLMADADLRQTLGCRARVSVMERFSLAKILAQWDLLFEELEVEH